MPQKIDSYSTTIGSSIDTRRIINPIKEAVVHDDIDTTRENTLGVKPFGGFHPLFITGTYPSENKVPNFPHPISIMGIRGKNFICTDLRMTLRENKGGLFTDRIKNQQEYDFMMHRHKLAMLWAGGQASEFRTGLRFGAFSYSVWLANAIKHLKGLNPHQQLQAQIVLMCFYYDLTCDMDAFDDSMYRTSQIPWVSAQMKNVIKDVENTILAIGNEPMRSLDDCVERIKKVIDSPLLANLNAGAVISAIRSHWYGHGVEPQQIIGVAVEDPPTWCALVLSALRYTGYKNSMIAQTVNNLGKRGEADAFVGSCFDAFDNKLRMEGFGVGQIVTPDNDTSMQYEVDGLVMRLEKTPCFGGKDD